MLQVEGDTAIEATNGNAEWNQIFEELGQSDLEIILREFIFMVSKRSSLLFYIENPWLKIVIPFLFMFIQMMDHR